jgi:hypothetical protein
VVSTIHPWECRIFLDTEFTDWSAPKLISLGMASEDGREFYGEVKGVDPGSCSEFVRSHVLPQLGEDPGLAMPSDELRESVRIWMSGFSGKKQRPVVCYDHPVDVQLLWELTGGRLVGWKEKLIATRIDHHHRERYFTEYGGRHHALHDARANRAACR